MPLLASFSPRRNATGRLCPPKTRTAPRDCGFGCCLCRSLLVSLHSRGFRDINRIARLANSAGFSGRTSFPVPTLIVISQELTAERYSSAVLSASNSSARWFSFGREMRLWIRTLVSIRYFMVSFSCGGAGLQTHPKSRPLMVHRSRRRHGHQANGRKAAAGNGDFLAGGAASARIATLPRKCLRFSWSHTRLGYQTRSSMDNSPGDIFLEAAR